MADELESSSVRLHQEDPKLESEVRVKEVRKPKKGRTSIKIGLDFEMPEAPKDGEPEKALTGPAKKAPVQKAAAHAASPRDIRAEDARPEEAGGAEETAKGGGGKSAFKRLKKAMAKDFGSLDKLKDGEDPTELARLVESFAAQGRKMCTFAGEEYGEENYLGFLAQLNRMVEAARAGDLDGLQTALEDLAETRNNCHAQYK